MVLDLEEAEQGIYAHVAMASGLGRPGQLVADEITDIVRSASALLQEQELEDPIAAALGLVPEEDGGAKGVCTIAALMLCNACLLQRRLRDEPEMNTILRLDKVAGAAHPREVLEIAWEAILDKDYAPVFRPALAVLRALPDSKPVHNAIRTLAECANRVADSLSELGYDHAGPLYHRILGSAKSDGAFYTNNLSAMMLARLAFPKDWINWSDPEAVAKLRIMDPACGTGTLLMATLQTIKARVAAAAEASDEDPNALHKRLVEDVLCGLDINQHGVQLAACNMTLGAPTVDYERMNLATMPHGPQVEGSPKAGSLEILTATDDERKSLQRLLSPRRSLKSLDATQVNENPEINFPPRELDAVIMNAPFTANENRSKKYGEAGRKAMQLHELGIQQHLEQTDADTKGVVTANSIGTFFTPLGDMMLKEKKSSTMAKVIPTTACTNTSGLAERRFLADRFHVEVVVTSHDPKRPNFSENTAIHESLLVCRRRNGRSGEDQPTLFVSLRAMPSTPEEAIEAAEAIATGTDGKWTSVFAQPEGQMLAGDWRPCQFLDPELISAAMLLEGKAGLVPMGRRHPIGPAGQRIRDAFQRVDGSAESYRVFWSRAKDLRTTMAAVPEQSVEDRKEALADRYRGQAGHILLASKFDTLSGKLLAIVSDEPALGSMWVPIQAEHTSLDQAKALCAWHNSTLGALGFLFRRSTKLTNPGFSQAEMANLPVPDFKAVDAESLIDAYERTKELEAKPWRHAADDRMRDELDCAAAETTGLDVDAVRDWRRRLAQEPTVSGQPHPYIETGLIRKDGMLVHHGPHRSNIDIVEFIHRQRDARHAMLRGDD